MMEHNSSSDTSLVSLNVGGQIYKTTRSTLTKYPESMLGAMFGGNFTPTCLDEEGNFFIDRDGEAFRIVLNYLRSGRVSLPKGFIDFDLLAAEADFYQIKPLYEAAEGLRLQMEAKARRPGYYIELTDYEECGYFCRYYIDPPQGPHAELKNGGTTVCGHRDALKMLPLPDKALKEMTKLDGVYMLLNISANKLLECAKISMNHFFQNNGWELINQAMTHATDGEGAYIVHKYTWFYPNVSN